MNQIIRFFEDEEGQSIVEYTLLLTLVGLVAITILTTMGVNIAAIFRKINDKLQVANDSISN